MGSLLPDPPVSLQFGTWDERHGTWNMIRGTLIWDTGVIPDPSAGSLPETLGDDEPCWGSRIGPKNSDGTHHSRARRCGSKRASVFREL